MTDDVLILHTMWYHSFSSVHILYHHTCHMVN